MNIGFHLNSIDLIVVAGSFLAVVAIGLSASRWSADATGTAKDHFMAAGKMPWWLIGPSFVSTSVSSEQLVGTIGAAYEHGMGIANWELFSLPVYIPLLVLFVPLYLRNGITTVPDLLVRRYGPLCGDIYTWAMLIAYVTLFLVPVLYSGAIAVHSLTGWSFFAVLWTIGAAVSLYTIIGGMRSIMWADAFQFILIFGGGLILFFAALQEIPGGWPAMARAAPERFHLYHGPQDEVSPFLGLLAGAVGVFLFYQATNQVMIQRVLSARSTWDGMMGVIFAGIINFFRPLVTCFLGFVVYHWIHVLDRAAPLENRDEAYAFALQEFAPDWGLRGLVLAGFIAAVMSSSSALANAVSTIFSLNVYRQLLRPNAGDAELILTGRIAVGGSMAIACLMAPLVGYWGGVFIFTQKGVTYLATPFISVLLIGVLWRGANYAGGLAGIIGGTAITILLAAGLPALGVHWNWLYVSFVAQLLTMTLVVVASKLSATPPPDGSQQLVWRPELLQSYDDDVVRPMHQRVSLWFGIYAIIWAIIYWQLW